MQNNNPKYKTDLNERCYLFSLAVIFLTDSLPNKRSAWVLSDQVIRSATSIGANLIEARSSSSRLEYKKFHEISLKSANETKYWLCLLKDSGLVSAEKTESLSKEVDEIAKMLAAGIIRLKSKF